MPPHVFLNEQHWASILDALYREILRQRQPPKGPLGQAWKLLARANQYKRFTIEVENADPSSALGANIDDNEEEFKAALRAGWPRPRKPGE